MLSETLPTGYGKTDAYRCLWGSRLTTRVLQANPIDCNH